MSEETPSWRSLASAASRSIKGYVSQRDFRKPLPTSRDANVVGSSRGQTWGQWAGQKLRQVQGESLGADQLLLFPGWATRRFHTPPQDPASDDAPFDIEVFVTGYASRSSGPGFGTRGGKAFIRLARSYAALPKLTATQGYSGTCTSDAQLNRLTQELLESGHLPPPPEEMDDDAELRALESQLRELDVDAEDASPGLNAETVSIASSCTSNSSAQSNASGYAAYANTDANGPSSNVSAEIQKWHTNLETRLHPFWSSALSGRPIRISLFATDPSLYEQDNSLGNEDDSPHQPLLRCVVSTTADGSFQTRFHVPWATLCQHPHGVQIAFGDRRIEDELYIAVELPPASQSTGSAAYHFSMRNTISASITVPLTYAPVRVISDIDDTVKLASVLSGARTVFQNVFVKDLHESVIPGMADWYTNMWKRGVRFHYVSNGPFEILPILNEFFPLSRLPPGSVKLRSYGGRSLFSGLLSAPAVRKRGGVVELLDNFPHSQFILVGDSGEQDLELYASIAKERPAQILAVFIRDVSANSGLPPLGDPTGSNVFEMDRATPPPLSRKSRGSTMRTPIARSTSDRGGTPKYAVRRPRRMQSDTMLSTAPLENSGSYFTSSSLTDSPVTEEPVPIEQMSTQSSPGMITEQVSYDTYGDARQVMSEAERRLSELQMRIWRARLDVPEHIPLRIFRQPEECEEANIILDGLIPGH